MTALLTALEHPRRFDFGCVQVETVFVVLESRSADRTPSPEELKDMEAKVLSHSK